jgi:two-component system chemotaxis sensor kinase CheA
MMANCRILHRNSCDTLPMPLAELPDDYFSECDEHLHSARQSVLALESSVGQKQVEAGPLEELFRSFHSIKGLSAMVGVGEAEELAHVMESFFGSLRRGGQVLTADGLTALADGVKTLEAAIDARREGRAPLDVSPAVTKIAALTQTKSAGLSTVEADMPLDLGQVHLSPSEKTRLETAVGSGSAIRWFAFAPSPALAERGINVGVVRKRLEELGQIVHASPQVGAGGRVAFAFVLATQADPAALATLANDGILLVEPATPSSDDVHAAATDQVTTEATARPRGNLVRVDLAKLDDLMRMVGELVVTRGRFEQTLRRAGAPHLPEHRALHETSAALERQLRELREAVTRVRLVPVREAFERMRFVVRDLMRGTDKTVELELVGEETEVDKLVVERITEPLLHLVRNAVSHGMESTTERTATGKPAAGHLTLRASTAGETVLIEVEDDGRGIDAPTVRSRAVAAGLIAADAEIDPGTLLDILTTPGFSTRIEADRASGRGVGMATVRAAVDDLGGSLEMSTSPATGTCFTIRVPLTLAILDALIVTVGEQRFAVPRNAVREVLRVERRNITGLADDEILQHRGRPVHLVHLARAFNMAHTERDAMYALILGSDESPVGLIVDGVEGLREIVVRPLTDPLVHQRGIAGATDLGDRRAVLILDTKSFVERRTLLPLVQPVSR